MTQSEPRRSSSLLRVTRGANARRPLGRLVAALRGPAARSWALDSPLARAPQASRANRADAGSASCSSPPSPRAPAEPAPHLPRSIRELTLALRSQLAQGQGQEPRPDRASSSRPRPRLVPRPRPRPAHHHGPVRLRARPRCLDRPARERRGDDRRRGRAPRAPRGGGRLGLVPQDGRHKGRRLRSCHLHRGARSVLLLILALPRSTC